MHYVYAIRSLSRPDQTYIGETGDLRRRIRQHNNGESVHTSKFIPWKLEFYLAFESKSRAREFETYLKSHSGKAFAQKRLWPLSVKQEKAS